MEEEDEDENVDEYDRIMRVLDAVEDEEEEEQEQEQKQDGHVPPSYSQINGVADLISLCLFLNLYGHSKHGLPLQEVFPLPDPEFHLPK